MARRTRLMLTMTPLGLVVQARPSGEASTLERATQVALASGCIAASGALFNLALDDVPRFIQISAIVLAVVLCVFGLTALYLTKKEHDAVERDDRAAWQVIEAHRLKVQTAPLIAEQTAPLAPDEEKSRSEALTFLTEALSLKGAESHDLPAAGELPGWTGRRWTTLMDLLGVYVERKTGRPKKGESGTKLTTMSIGQCLMAVESRSLILPPYPKTEG